MRRTETLMPNDKVLCVDDEHTLHYQGAKLKKGAVYCVREIAFISDVEYVKVVGIQGDIDPVSRQERAFKASRFRLIHPWQKQKNLLYYSHK